MPPATLIVHWPVEDTAVCEYHAQKLVNLGAHMGVRVSITPCEETVCANCENEAKKRKAL